MRIMEFWIQNEFPIQSLISERAAILGAGGVIITSSAIYRHMIILDPAHLLFITVVVTKDESCMMNH